MGDEVGCGSGRVGIAMSVTYLDAIRSAQEKAMEMDSSVFIYG